MAVRVRLFAALREAAGTDEIRVAPAPLPVVLASLCDRFGEPFTTRLVAASVLVDGTASARDSDVDIADGTEIALLPPVSGGSTVTGARSPERGAPGRGRVAAIALPAAAVAVTLGGLAVGQRAFVAVAVAVAILALLDLSALLARDVARPVLLTALIPPVAVAAVGVSGEPSGALDRLPSALALMFVATLVLLLVSPRRRDAASVAAATAMVGLAAGAGCAGLVALYGAHGAATVFALVLLGALPPLVAALVAVVQPAGPAPAVRAGATAVVAVALFATYVPPLPTSAVVALAAVAGLAVEGAVRLVALLGADRGVSSARGGLGDGQVVVATGGLLLAAPALHLLLLVTTA